MAAQQPSIRSRLSKNGSFQLNNMTYDGVLDNTWKGKTFSLEKDSLQRSSLPAASNGCLTFD